MTTLASAHFRAFSWRLCAAAIAVCGIGWPACGQEPGGGVDALLAADRRFAAAADRMEMVDALAGMFADSVVMPLPGGRFARTRDEARAALAANPANRGARVSWRPVRAALSGDGKHGFTAGYMTVKTDTGVIPAKYLAYWVRGTKGWEVAAYKRGFAGKDSPTAMLPVQSFPAVAGSATDAGAHLRSLVAAEKQFSDSSQNIGLGPAFAIFGRDDAINMGAPGSPAFTYSAAEIGKDIGGGASGPSPVSWSADFALVAASGDLGVTFGLIKRNDPSATQPPAAFFTVWARPGGVGVWRYIAE